MLNEVIRKITEQQKGHEHDTVFGCGEQLKDICRKNPKAAEIVCRDLDIKEMSIEACEKQIKQFADEIQKKTKGQSAFVSPQKAQEIICKFYGIENSVAAAENAAVAASANVDLFDLI